MLSWCLLASLAVWTIKKFHKRWLWSGWNINHLSLSRARVRDALKYATPHGAWTYDVCQFFGFLDPLTLVTCRNKLIIFLSSASFGDLPPLLVWMSYVHSPLRKCGFIPEERGYFVARAQSINSSSPHWFETADKSNKLCLARKPEDETEIVLSKSDRGISEDFICWEGWWMRSFFRSEGWFCNMGKMGGGWKLTSVMPKLGNLLCLSLSRR